MFVQKSLHVWFYTCRRLCGSYNRRVQMGVSSNLYLTSPQGMDLGMRLSSAQRNTKHEEPNAKDAEGGSCERCPDSSTSFSTVVQHEKKCAFALFACCRLCGSWERFRCWTERKTTRKQVSSGRPGLVPRALTRERLETAQG